MALSIDRLTNIITVPKADLAHVIGTLYEHDTDAFWDELKALEAAEEGIVFVDAQSHNLEYTVVGITYAQKVEMINGPNYKKVFVCIDHKGVTEEVKKESK